MTKKPFHVVELSLTPEAEDLASGFALSQGATGVETRDSTTLLGPLGGGATTSLLAYFDSPEAARSAAEAAPRILGDRCLSAQVKTITDPGWRLAWRDYFGPMLFGDRLWITPPDEHPARSDADVVVSLVPSGAFGTGTHETTGLILELLTILVRPGCTVLDVGCGSGILALAALRLGASHALGLDIDPEAIKAADENAENNALTREVRFSTAPLEQAEGCYDLVLANLSARELPPLVAQLADRVAPGGMLLWSGLLTEELDQMPEPPGLQKSQDHHRGEWSARLFRRPP